MFARDIHTEIFAEAVQDKIFDTEIVAAPGRAISHTNPDFTRSAINFFTAAVAQGARIRSFCGFTEIVTAGFRHKIFDVVTIPHLLEAKLMVEFWSHGLNSIHIVT